MEDRFKSRFWDEKNKVMTTHLCSMQTAFNRFDCGNTYGLLYMLVSNPELIRMACTGLKDKSGELIYEGDIVKRDAVKELNERKIVSPVKYGRWCFVINGYALFDSIRARTFTVIGNIYQNPDLKLTFKK